MASIVCRLDTDSKELSVSVDGQTINNVICVTLEKYKDPYDEEKEIACVRISAHEAGETTDKMQSVTYVSNADLGVKSMGGLYKVNSLEEDVLNYLKR